MSETKNRLIRLAHQHPELRAKLLPLIRQATSKKAFVSGTAQACGALMFAATRILMHDASLKAQGQKETGYYSIVNTVAQKMWTRSLTSAERTEAAATLREMKRLFP